MDTNDTQIKTKKTIIELSKETLALCIFTDVTFFLDPSLFLSLSLALLIQAYFLPHLPVNDEGRGATPR